MKQERRLYPISEQDFPELRRRNFAYIDKTRYVYQMTHSDAKYMFLSRPRRFGKSLLISTLHAYFEGRRELFEGLAIEQLENEWAQYPVIRIDMSIAKHEKADELDRYLISILVDNEQRLGLSGEGQDANLRLKNLIVNVYQQTGRQVVVLIDEYDAPLLDVVHEEENLPKLRKKMRNFYSPLKACSPYLRYVFLTGITKFSQLSIFSELNNIKNISMLPEYAAICGISKDELLTQLSVDIDILAKKQHVTHDKMVDMLIDNYDGYHFTWPSPDIFNPYSLLNAFADGMIDSYWFGSGTPTYLIEMMRKFHTLPSQIKAIKAEKEIFDAPAESLRDITPLLYQSGYLTIKSCDENDIYTLDLPNREIRNGLMKILLQSYVDRPMIDNSRVLRSMSIAIDAGDMNSALTTLQTYLLTIPYTNDTAYEGHYQQVLYIIFSLMDYSVDVEVHTATGRVDLVMQTANEIYLMEIKLNANVDIAMRQIMRKNYAARFALRSLPIVKVAMNFDTVRRTISTWKIER